jgi:hypothetical protein
MVRVRSLVLEGYRRRKKKPLGANFAPRGCRNLFKTLPVTSNVNEGEFNARRFVVNKIVAGKTGRVV